MTGLIDLLRSTGLSGWVAFLIVYHFGTQGAWRRSRVGPWLVSLGCLPLLTLVTGAVSTSLGAGHPLAQVLRLVLMLAFNVMPLWLAVLFVRRQREIGGPNGEDRPEQVHEGDSGSGERRVRAVSAGDHGE